MSVRSLVLSVVALVVLAVGAFGDPAHAERRALVIGVGNYKNLPHLKGPLVDAPAVWAKLMAAGYDTKILLDPDRAQLLKAFATLAKSIGQGDEVVVYYSGHGVDVDGAAMMLGIDAPRPEDVDASFELSAQAIPLRQVMVTFDDHEPDVQGWILDACRDNPYGARVKSAAPKGGLPKMSDNPTSSFIIYAADFPNTSLDALVAGGSSPFTKVFLDKFDANKNMTVPDYLISIRGDLRKLVAPNKQFPELSEKFMHPWCFGTCVDGLQSVQVAKAEAPITFHLIGHGGGTKSLEGGSGGHGVTDNPPPNKTVVSNVALVEDPTAGPSPLETLTNSGPAIFLGKASAGDCKAKTVSDLYPFGCPMLRELLTTFKNGGLRPSFSRKLTAETDVNVRARLPEVGPKSTKYACRVATIKAGETVVLRSAVALKYLDDTFYFGVLDSGPTQCKV